jgi:hypothetical protein
MKRRTLKQLRAMRQPQDHHHVYVVWLDPAVAKLRAVRAENPKRDPQKPCVYVGMTGLKRVQIGRLGTFDIRSGF